MSHIYKIVDDNGNLIGFELDGRLIEMPDEYVTEQKRLRVLLNELVNALLALPPTAGRQDDANET